MADRRFPELPNVPVQHIQKAAQDYADYLNYYNANPMVPRADDPVGYVAPSEEQSIFTEYNQEPLSNYGFTEAEEYLRSAGKSFKNAVTGQGVATLLPEMQFYPYGPTGAEYVYGGVADAGLGIFSSIVAGLSGAAGFVAEQIPFQTEAEEDRFARDALGMLEFAEVQYLPLAGMFSQIGQLAKASKVTTAVAKAPEIAPDLPIEAQEFDELLDNLDNINFEEIEEPGLSMEELSERLRPQMTDDQMDDAIAGLIEEETDPEVLINNALLEREATGATFTPEDDQLLNDLELTDADFSEIDEANASYDRIMNERIDVALDSRPEFQDPSVRLGVQSLRESGSSVDQIERYLDDIRRAKGPVYQISEAEFADQLRDLYERSNLPIPKNDAEERAADLIIQVAAGEKVTPSLRRGVDVDYLQANAPETVFNQAKPTIQETLEAERQYGILNNVSVGQETDIGALSGAFGFYNKYAPTFSPSMKAAESLPQEKGSYKSLKKWMLRNGAKAKELEWSGADEAFEGRTDVTKTELIQYLNENKDLVEAERKVAKGVLRSEGGDTRVAVENYIENNLADTAYYLRENFEQDWEYSTQLESISDYVAAGDYEGLDQIAEFMDGVEDGAALAEKYPDGWIGDYNPMNRQWSIYADKDSAIRHDAPDFDDMARESLRESLDEMEQYDPEEYGRMVFGDAGASADTSELEYTQYFPSGGTNTTETTYQFRDPTGRLPDDYFTEAHFGETGRDTNLVAHVRTAEFPVDGGGTAFHVGEIQSDAAQSLRDKNKQTGEVTKYTPRTREQEIQTGQIEYLTQQLGNETRGAETLLNKMVFGDEVSIRGWGRDGYPEQLETYKTIIADFKNKQSGIDGFEGYEPDQIESEFTFFTDSLGSIGNMGSELDAFAQYIKDVSDDVPPEYVEWADSYIQNTVPKIDSLSSGLRRFDNQDFSKTRTGAPFIESTDAWVNMTLKRQLMDAVESGADYITLPNPEMVKKYTYGDIEGHRAFYGEIAPSNLLDIAKSYDPDAKLVGKLIETEAAVESVTALPLTRRLVEAMMEKGVSTYAVPLAVGAGAGYGALDQVGGENGQSGS